MPTKERSLTLTELATVAGVTPRTVRYYIAQGLLPGPDEVGRGAHYGEAHFDRLALIRRLQREHQPLAEIRARMAELDDDEIHALLAEPAPAPASDSALDYVRNVLGGGPPKPALLARQMSASTLAEPPAPDYLATPKPTQAPTIERSQWDRVAITPDIEIHIRRPLDRRTNQRIERLIATARELLEDQS